MIMARLRPNSLLFRAYFDSSDSQSYALARLRRVQCNSMYSMFCDGKKVVSFFAEKIETRPGQAVLLLWIGTK